MAIQQQAAAPASFAELFQAVVTNVQQVIQGKREVIELAVVCLASEGHLLVEDVPGVGKTSLAKALAASIDCTWGRIQFTPDLLPSDVIGVSVWHRGKDAFEFRRGPIFADIVLADEINRASPKTQSALLEAMEERQVTVDGVSYPLGNPFMVMATQNPIEHEGTYPLPESQLDRFLMRLEVGYPNRQAEIEILDRHGEGSRLAELQPVITALEMRGMATAGRAVHVAPALKGYLVDLAEATRRHSGLALGASPRATLALLRASRVLAASSGRNYVTPDDIKALAIPVLAHRMAVTPEAQIQGMSTTTAVQEALASVPVPVPTPR